MLQRNFDQAANQAASRAESLVDKVSQGAQSAAGSMADVIESFKSETMTVVGVPPFLSVQDCWLPTCLLWGLAVLHWSAPALLHMRPAHRCAVQWAQEASRCALTSREQQAPSSHSFSFNFNSALPEAACHYSQSGRTQFTRALDRSSYCC